MRFNVLMKNPILGVGILLCIILLFQLRQKGWMDSRRAKLTPSSCRALLVKLDRRIPANWKSRCEGRLFNNLAIEITMPDKIKLSNTKDLRAYLYRETANALIFVAKTSPSDNLERTDLVRLKLIHPKMKLNALSEGPFVAKLATLTNKKMIAHHIHSTVKTQEIMPNKPQN